MTKILAQSPTPTLRHYTIDDGLPSSQVYQAMQDSRGYMWFATDRGVAQYNGYEIKTFSSEDGLTDNVVFRMFEDYRDRIWMITLSGNIFIYENNKISSFKYNSKLAHLVKGSYQMEIEVDSSDIVYIGCTRGLFTVDSTGLVKKNNTIQISTEEKLRYTIFESDSLKFPLPFGPTSLDKVLTHIYYVQNTKLDSFYYGKRVNGRLNAIRSKNNSLFFTLGKTLNEMKNNLIIELARMNDPILNLFEDSDSNLWLCTMKGLYQFPKTGNYKEYNYYLTDTYISNITQDKEDGNWITTIDDGLYFMANNKINNFISNRKNRVPLSLTSDKSNVYASYFNGELTKMNSRNIIDIAKNTKYKLLYHIFYDTTSSRLYFNGDTMRYMENNKITSVNKGISISGVAGFAKNKNGLFSGHNWAVYKIVSDSIQTLVNVKMKINGIFTNDKNEILLACIDGAYKYNEASKMISLINPALKDVRVNTIASMNGSMFFATQTNGLMCLQEDGSFKSIRKSDGLSANSIHKIFVAKNSIWCSTNNGISKIEFTDLKTFKYNITNISTKEGLLSNEINDIHILNDTVWVASKKGISLFSSNTNFVNHSPPVVTFTSLKVNNTEAALQESNTFSHKENTISIAFESPLFKSDGKQEYSYILTNERDSITGLTTNREVEFLSLKPGKYTLSVKAKNNSGVWSAKNATLQFTIQSPWWATNLFTVFLTLLSGTIVFAIYKLRMSKIKEKYSLEKKQASLQLTAMRAQMNPHFIFNVMSSIRNYMQNNNNSAAERYLTSFAKLVRYTLDSSEIQEVPLEEELQSIRNYTQLEMQRFEQGFDFEIRCEDTVDTEDTMMPSLLLQPFVENAIKHGIERITTKGRILVEIKKINASIMISIEDNGVGRTDASEWNAAHRGSHTSFGSKLTLERITAFNKAFNRNIRVKVIDLTSQGEKLHGTRVEILF